MDDACTPTQSSQTSRKRLGDVLKDLGLGKCQNLKSTKICFYPQTSRQVSEPLKVGEKVPDLDDFYKSVILTSDTSEIAKLQSRYENGNITPSQVAAAILKIIKGDEKTHSIVQFDEKRILEQAEESTGRYELKKARLLEGVPFAVKECIQCEGYQCRAGIPLELEPDKETAFIVQNLLDEGAMLMGTTNMHQIGLGTSGTNPSEMYKGGARNPWSLEHYPGGSSSGSATAVASGLVVFSIGNDGGGSVRIPAAVCGLIGLKPTFGRLSYDADGSEGSSVTQSGPMARCAEDIALVYAIMTGISPRCLPYFPQPVPRLLVEHKPKYSVGVWAVPPYGAVDAQLLKMFHGMIDCLVTANVMDTEDVEIPNLRYAKLAHIIAITSEIGCKRNYLLSKEYIDLVNPEVKEILEDTRLIRGTDYVLAARHRATMIEVFENLFYEKGFDFIATPTLGSLPGTFARKDDFGEPATMFQYIGNLIGLPAITIPIGISKSPLTGAILPVSIQFYAPWWKETELYHIASMVQGTTDMKVFEQSRMYDV